MCPHLFHQPLHSCYTYTIYYESIYYILFSTNEPSEQKPNTASSQVSTGYPLCCVQLADFIRNYNTGRLILTNIDPIGSRQLPAMHIWLVHAIKQIKPRNIRIRCISEIETFILLRNSVHNIVLSTIFFFIKVKDRQIQREELPYLNKTCSIYKLCWLALGDING